MRRTVLICLFSLLVASPAGAGLRSYNAPDGARCASGSLGEVASSIFGAGTEVVGREQVAGLAGALVLEPRIYPGTRARLVQVEDRWCEASSSFNLAWEAAGRSFEGPDGAEAAAVYAQLAAAPYFDDVRIVESSEKAPGVYLLTTHAVTNGVVADWVIVLDDDGIRQARWTATRFAQQPLQPQTEGLTALPGATETYTRSAMGMLVAARGLPTAESARSAAAPSIAQYVSPDDFVIAVSVGDTKVAVDPGQDTGVRKADIVRENLRAIELNYQEFYDWGLRKGWGELEPVSGPDKGYVYVNDALSLYCFACVFMADDFQIHMFSEIEVVLGVLGFTFPDSVKAYQSVLGHEMFHNFQNRYNKPGPFQENLAAASPRRPSIAYTEGTARAQESLHSYADVLHQPGSPTYANNINGCNGYGSEATYDEAMAAGLFDKGYSACYFWLPWFAAEGTDGVKRLIAKAYPKVSEESDVHLEGVRALERANDLSVAEQVARFAGAAITGRGYRVNGLDWGRWLEQWVPMAVAAGDKIKGTLQPSGVMVGELTSPVTIRVPKRSEISLFVIVDTGSRTYTKVIDSDNICFTGLGTWKKVYVGGVRTKKGSDKASIAISKFSC